MSADGDHNWCVIPGPMLAQQGAVWLREPAWADRGQLVERLRNGSYGKPFVVDDGEARRLHFDLGFMQSEMSLGDPYSLTFRYARKMMAFLLFQPRPRHVVVVGLGGGSLTRFCHRQLRRARITTVEVDEDVIALGALFELPRGGKRLRLVRADARDYFVRDDDAADAILMDACNRRGTAPELCSKAFYQSLRARLAPQGLAVVNLTGPRSRAHLRYIDEVFERRTMVIEVQDCNNRLAFAFNGIPPDWDAVAPRAAGLAQRYGLDFDLFARLLRQAHERRTRI